LSGATDSSLGEAEPTGRQWRDNQTGTPGYFNHLGLEIDAGVDEVHIFQYFVTFACKGFDCDTNFAILKGLNSGLLLFVLAETFWLASR
jgi:hypothetical protein